MSYLHHIHVYLNNQEEQRSLTCTTLTSRPFLSAPRSRLSKRWAELTTQEGAGSTDMSSDVTHNFDECCSSRLPWIQTTSI